MSEIITCTHCKAKLRVATAKPGAKLRCPKCQKVFALPQNEEEVIEAVEERKEEKPPRGVVKVPTKAPAAPLHKPEPEDEEEEKAPTRGKRARRDEDDEDEEAPRRPKRKIKDDDEEEEQRPRRRVWIGEWLQYGAAHYSSVAVPMLGYYVVTVLVTFLGLYLAGLCMLEVSTALGIVMQLVVSFASLPLMAGFHIVAIAQLHGKKWDFSDFFGGFKYFGPLLTNLLFFILALIGLGIPIAILMAAVADTSLQVPVNILGVLCFYMVLIFMCCFSHQLIIDKKYGGLQSLSRCWSKTNGYRIQLLIAFFVLTIITLLPAAIVGYIVFKVFDVSLTLEGLTLKGLLIWMSLQLLLPMFATMFVMPFIYLCWDAGYLLWGGSKPPRELPAADGMEEDEDEDEDKQEEEEEEEEERPRKKTRR